MDLIRELKDVRFELNLRGYDCDAVDAFLAKVRSEVAEVQSQREGAQSRVAALEEQLASGESDTEGTLRRTLILAQRLADETVADARQTATEMVETATSDADKATTLAQDEAARVLSSANDDAVALRSEAQADLDTAHTSASRVAEESEVEAARTRAVATEEAQLLLVNAERAGADRVLSLESTSQEEVARMREPIRVEVGQLEETRSRLLDDIRALEHHLGEQRDRVRNAVESLRLGMSGSIDDLERVAADDALLSAAPRPDLSHASADDVDVAPDVEIVEQVEQNATPAPSVEQLAESAAAEVGESVDKIEVDFGDHQPHAHMIEDISVEQIDDEFLDSTDDMGEATERIPVVDVDDSPSDDAPSDDSPSEDSPLEESAPTVEDEIVLAVEDDAASSDVVDLDATPSPLFGTDVAQDATVLDARSTETADVDTVDDSSWSERSFLERFTEAIDTLPIGGER